ACHCEGCKWVIGGEGYIVKKESKLKESLPAFVIIIKYFACGLPAYAAAKARNASCKAFVTDAAARQIASHPVVCVTASSYVIA
ncbi:MAG TPA: hypothetical protein DCS68_06085, partial [Pantoea agglomerans]|nr:hypothetical protein [Pantoea agglomerans]